MTTIDLAIWVFLAVLYGLFWWWYTMPRGPLSSDDIEALFERGQRSVAPERWVEVEARFREFAESDDGREFFMVNMIQERKGDYQDEDGRTVDPRKLDRQYNREWARAYLPLATFPLYIGKIITPMQVVPSTQPWEKVAIVRYRSRRDFLDVAFTESIQASFDKKFASLAQTEIFASVPLVITAMPRLLVALVLIAIGALCTGL